MINRIRPLPTATLRGHFRLATGLIDETREALSSFFEAGRRDGGHEGICFWAGTEQPSTTTFEAVIVPAARHGPRGVFVSAGEFADAVDDAHDQGLGILAQVHSHPSWDTRHSDGDDELIVMPFEGMLSLVAPFYGRTIASIGDLSVHQFQDHRWVLCTRHSVFSGIRTEPVQ